MSGCNYSHLQHYILRRSEISSLNSVPSGMPITPITPRSILKDFGILDS